MATSITVPVPSSEDYTAPETSQSRIAEKWSRMPSVDQNGRTVASADTGTVDVTGAVGQPAPGQAPTMADAIIAAANAVGVDVAGLADSAKFMRDIGSVSPADTEAVTMAVADALTANPALATAPVAPGMATNRAQGSGGSVAAPNQGRTPLDRIRAEASKDANQPIPPGSTVR